MLLFTGNTKRKIALFMVNPSAFGTSPFRGGSLIVSFVDVRGKAAALVPPLKGEGDREAVERSTVNGANSPLSSICCITCE